ncbi:hypothetical protein BDR03DRAFT_977963 [Suillus americanus]|nr:hypothetical protein BDR03DRAFT_977963 [Suillus americanus]
MASPLEIALRLQTVKYFKMIGLAILINLTWGRRWDFIRIIFAAARYMPFVGVPVDLSYTLGPTSSELLCASAYRSTKSPHVSTLPIPDISIFHLIILNYDTKGLT